MSKEKPSPHLVLDEAKIAKVQTKVLKEINKHKLSIRELLVLYGNLGYTIGASIAGFEGKGPSIQELERSYALAPTVDVGLMLQGLLITGWEHDFIKQPRISKLAQTEQSEEKQK